MQVNRFMDEVNMFMGEGNRFMEDGAMAEGAEVENRWGENG